MPGEKHALGIHHGRLACGASSRERGERPPWLNCLWQAQAQAPEQVRALGRQGFAWVACSLHR